jgi:hypothetical protein
MAGAADNYFHEYVYTTETWRGFYKVRTRLWQVQPESMEAKRAWARKHYATKVKAKRSTPEAKAKLARQRRERYARSKAAVAKVVSEVPDILGSV